MLELDGKNVETLKPFADGLAEEPHSPEEIAAVLEAMFLLAIADGEVAPDELARFARSAAPLIGELSDGDVEGTFADFASQLSDDGWDARLRAVGATLKESALRDRAYRLAVAVAMIDDHVVPEEAGAMDALAEALGLGTDLAHELVRKVYYELFPALRIATRHTE